MSTNITVNISIPVEAVAAFFEGLSVLESKQGKKAGRVNAGKWRQVGLDFIKNAACKSVVFGAAPEDVGVCPVVAESGTGGVTGAGAAACTCDETGVCTCGDSCSCENGCKGKKSSNRKSRRPPYRDSAAGTAPGPVGENPFAVMFQAMGGTGSAGGVENLMKSMGPLFQGLFGATPATSTTPATPATPTVAQSAAAAEASNKDIENADVKKAETPPS